jgi:hypothetical protein
MCTVSWIHHAEGYHLLCNRDEQRTRGIAAAPAMFGRAGTRFIAPTDVDYGGTWIAVNEHGLGLCLLNAGRRERAGQGRSRGFVIPELIRVRSAGECAFTLGQFDLAPFAPFTLLMLEPGGQATIAAWDGRTLATERNADRRAPLVSSSFDPEGVRRSRIREYLRQTTGDAASLYRFHTNHGAGGAGNPYSTCMHRPDAETVSFSWVVVNRDQVRFLYVPAAPCRCVPGERSILPRAA